MNNVLEDVRPRIETLATPIDVRQISVGEREIFVIGVIFHNKSFVLHPGGKGGAARIGNNGNHVLEY